VGAKTAQRLIVDLRDKVGDIGMDILPGQAPDASTEALEALIVLGYNRNLAQKAVQKAKQQSQDASVEELIKNALQSL
jgi:Holliday junction DNA helicase RuvA